MGIVPFASRPVALHHPDPAGVAAVLDPILTPSVWRSIVIATCRHNCPGSPERSLRPVVTGPDAQDRVSAATSSPGELVRVADGVDPGNLTVLHGKAHRSVELTAEVDPGAW